MATVEQLIAMVGGGLSITERERADLTKLLTPVARVFAYLDARRGKLPDLLDFTAAPDRAIPAMAQMLGLGPELPEAYGLTVAEQRRIAAAIVSLWKRKGTRRSVRDLIAAMTGRRPLILEWSYYRWIIGSGPMIHTIPAPGGVGAPYTNPEYVSDLWIEDAADLVDWSTLSRILSLVRPMGERLNMRPALHVEDGLGRLDRWDTSAGGGSAAFDQAAGELTSNAGRVFRADAAGLEDAWSDYRATYRIRWTVDAALAVLHVDTANHYRIQTDTSGAQLTLSRVVGGVATPLTSAAWPLVAGVDYLISVDAVGVVGGAEIRVVIDGSPALTYTDTSGAALTAGPPAWWAVTGSATLSTALTFSHSPPLYRGGPNP